MNTRILVAKELLKAAKAVLADTDYIYDPEHRKRPEGGGWEKTEKGWTQNKRKDGEKQENPQNALMEDEASQKSVARNPKTPAETLVNLSKSSSEDVRRGVAVNSNTPADTLNALSQDENENVRRSLSFNRAAPAEALDRLSKDRFVTTRLNVALHPNTSEKTLDRLTNDPSYTVRLGVAANENTPKRTLWRLLKDYAEEGENFREFEPAPDEVKNEESFLSTVYGMALKNLLKRGSEVNYPEFDEDGNFDYWEKDPEEPEETYDEYLARLHEEDNLKDLL